jgi:hypothetical protein
MSLLRIRRSISIKPAYDAILIRRRSASRKQADLLERPSLEPEDVMAKAAKRKIELPEEPSPKSLMARLAALQAEFAAKLQKQDKK